MFEIIKQLAIKWLKAQFKGNPLVENTSEYLTKVGSAFQVGFVATVVFISLGFLGSFIIVIGAIKGWF